jgi:hypothetical protein
MRAKHFTIRIDRDTASHSECPNPALGSPTEADPRGTTAWAERSGRARMLFLVSAEAATEITTTTATATSGSSQVTSEIQIAYRRLARAKRLRQSAERLLAAAVARREIARRNGRGQAVRYLRSPRNSNVRSTVESTTAKSEFSPLNRSSDSGDIRAANG